MLIRIGIVLALCMLPLFALAETPPLAPPTVQEVQAVQQQGRYLATVTLENGRTIELVLEGKYMPYTVANFVKLAQADYYDGQEFFLADGRKLANGEEMGFISGGDPSGGGPGYQLRMEFSPYLLQNLKGAVSMFRKSPLDCSGSQFVITWGAVPMFDGAFPVFGWVKSGIEAAAAVQKGDKMTTVTVAPYAGAEECPVLTPAAEVAAHTPPTMAEIDAVKKQGRYLATITFENGKKIAIVLEGAEMPITVANFVKLAQATYYDGLNFHRIVNDDGFQIIQGGDPAGNGGGGPGYMIRMEQSSLIHKQGAVAMARQEDADTAGSQFYICRCDIPALDGRYAVFGWVKEGLDVVGAVTTEDKMQSVTVVPYQGKEACPVIIERAQ